MIRDNLAKGTSDYTDLTNKPQINGVMLSGNKTSADLGISGGGSNPNLLDNAWFTVNQKGNTSGTVQDYVHSCFIDRWKTSYSDGTDSLSAVSYDSTNETITLAPNVTESRNGECFLVQNPEEKLWDYLYGKTVTFSILLSDNRLFTQTRTFSNGYGSIIQIDDDLRLEIGLYQNQKNIGFGFFGYMGTSTNPSVTIKALKLELGTESTLALDTAPDYTTELLKCQRYFYRIKQGYFGIGYCQNATELYGFLTLPSPMRANPTLSYSGELKMSMTSSYPDKVATNIVLYAINGTSLILRYTSSEMIEGVHARLRTDGYIDLSAEL